MATKNLLPVPKFQFLDNNGKIVPGGKVFTYDAGTTNKRSTFTDSTGSTPNLNPIILDANGRCDIWITSNTAYKIVFSPASDTDPPTNAFWTEDQITADSTLRADLAASSGSSLVGFTAAGAGAVPIDLQTWNRQWVSVLGFAANGASGARVDATGVIDSTLGIQAAVDFLFSVGGGTLYVPAGTYKITSTIIWKDSVNLLGAGRNATIFNYTGASIAFDTSYTALQTEGVEFHGFKITSLTGTIGIRYQGAISITLGKVEITGVSKTGFTTAGLQISPQNAGAPSISIIVDDCDIHENNGFGIQCLPAANDVANHIVISKSRVRNNSGNIRGTGELLAWTIVGNNLEAGSNTGAVSFTDISGLTIIGNYFEQAGQTAIDLSFNAEIGGVVVEGNFIQGNGSGTGIIVGGAQYVAGASIKNNQISNWATGISAVAVKSGCIGPNKYASCTTNLAVSAVPGLIQGLLVQDELAGLQAFVMRMQNSQGVSVSAANNLVLGNDGNYFQISGATQINLLSNINWQGGAEVTLKFNSTPTVKHNQATSTTNVKIILNGGVDFVAAANNTLTLRYDSTDVAWYEQSRKV